MKVAPLPENEDMRLVALSELEILDTEPDEQFESITYLLSRLLAADYTAISLIDTDRQWLLSERGLGVKETPRDVAFCAHTILQDETLMVEDTHLDERFHDNPLVTGGPKLRSYLGHPIKAGGCTIGSLCAIYKSPQKFGKQNKKDLAHLARIVEQSIAMRQRTNVL